MKKLPSTLSAALPIAIAATAALGMSATAHARSSSESEFRGYSTCVSYADQRSNGLVPEREYLIDKSGQNTLLRERYTLGSRRAQCYSRRL